MIPRRLVLNCRMNCDLTLGLEKSKLRLLRVAFDLDPPFIAMGLIVESKLMAFNKSLLQALAGKQVTVSGQKVYRIFSESTLKSMQYLQERAEKGSPIQDDS